MRHIDFEVSIPDSTNYDVIVVGCGAAGIFCASKLASQGKSVLIVESGEESEIDKYQNLNSIQEIAKKQSNPIWNRKRMLGGTTTAWGGQSLPFSPIDFTARKWMPGDWPIKYEDLQEHYIIANQFMGVDTYNYDSDITQLTGVQDPGFNNVNIWFHFSKWAPEPNFWKLKHQGLPETCFILYHAHCTRLIWRDKHSIDGIEIASLSGKRLTVYSKAVFLATGGIESTRMLLLSAEDPNSPLAQASPWLGKGYMDHPSIEVAEVIGLTPLKLYKLQKQFGTQLYRSWKYSVRMSASTAWQATNQLPNISSHFLFLPHHTRDWLGNLRSALQQPSVINAWRLLRVCHLVILGLIILAAKRIVYRSNAKTVVCIMSEQPATSESCVTLADTLDPFGLKQACIHWTIDPVVGKGIAAFSQLLKSELKGLNICELKLDPMLSLLPQEIVNLTSDVNHHMGGAKMSSTPEGGVVDQWMRPWGVTNLFVCSASVFPTSSHSNPTLTLLALCSRLLTRLSSLANLDSLNEGNL
ncbi:GMC oxidoreductase [Synechococcus sp. EJ6-Ellesmere]|uniref:GMC oxidoreductase n=1 Tax=Synechococcus sp. EJ6-Ellesmere TaxID=2823734 RepID=UPI0020CBFBAC|nr:GMC oxidoreductase [Synechococcus sp. EJ6-Ellesmere]MCP9825033.1 GMC family oxidoreductase [Synechococcus sp. EJ6-Ellesmere]